MESEGKRRVSAASSSSSGFIYSIWCLTWYPGRRKKLLWAEEKPSILSVLKFDSEVQDPRRQKANWGGGKKGREGRRFSFFFFTARRVKSSNTPQPPTQVSSFIRVMFPVHLINVHICSWTVKLAAVIAAEWPQNRRFLLQSDLRLFYAQPCAALAHFSLYLFITKLSVSCNLLHEKPDNTGLCMICVEEQLLKGFCFFWERERESCSVAGEMLIFIVE